MTHDEQIMADWKASETTFPKYWLGAYNKQLGLAVMRQKSAAENSQLVVAIMLPKEEAESLAVKIVAELEEKG